MRHHFYCRSCGVHWGPSGQPSPEDASLCYNCVKRVPTMEEDMQARLAKLEEEIERLKAIK